MERKTNFKHFLLGLLPFMLFFAWSTHATAQDEIRGKVTDSQNETIMAVSCSNTATGSGSEGNFNPFSWYAIYRERGHELFYEGCRKVDMIRFGRYYSDMKALGREPSSEYFPLPNYAVQQAAQSGYKLTQYYTRDNYDGPDEKRII